MVLINTHLDGLFETHCLPKCKPAMTGKEPSAMNKKPQKGQENVALQPEA